MRLLEKFGLVGAGVCFILIGLQGLTQVDQSLSSLASHRLIVPGSSAGELRLGDSREKVLKLFPFKPNVDQEFEQGPDCGTEFLWVDAKKPHYGNMFIRMKDNMVSQIDIATDRFITKDGISIDSSPEQVRKHYPGMQAYILSDLTSEALGGVPVIYWVNSEKGIAFGFARSKKERKRYLYDIILFRPHSEVCPPDDSPNSPDKRKLVPYSLEVSR